MLLDIPPALPAQVIKCRDDDAHSTLVDIVI
jgi:hypothetical protein